jgi:transposase
MEDGTTSLCCPVRTRRVRILAAADAGGELELLVQTTAELVGCPACGALARAKDPRPSWVRDLPIGGRPVVLCWWKRVWCCRIRCARARTWTEQHRAIAPRAGLTERARAFEQAGAVDAALSRVAATLGEAWRGGR